MHKNVYLAGPISGLSYDEATGWRNMVTQHLAERGIKCHSPLRGRAFNPSEWDTSMPMGNPLLSDIRGMFARDRFDATHCTVLFVNLIGAKRVSLGSCMEIAWANLLQIPVVLCMECAGNIHENTFMLEAVDYRVASVEDGITVVTSFLESY